MSALADEVRYGVDALIYAYEHLSPCREEPAAPEALRALRALRWVLDQVDEVDGVERGDGPLPLSIESAAIAGRAVRAAGGAQ